MGALQSSLPIVIWLLPVVFLGCFRGYQLVKFLALNLDPEEPDKVGHLEGGGVD